MRLLVFVAGSVGIVSLSWRSMRSWRTHGFYRFFAFELLLALVVRNAGMWLRDPLSARQIVSYLLGAVSVALAVEGFRLLTIVGKPSAAAAEKTNLAFENTTTLVEVGAYRWIRHPLYASLLALTWCAWLKDPLDIASLVLWAGATAFLAATAAFEERENVARFGAAYVSYMKRTRRFVPWCY